MDKKKNSKSARPPQSSNRDRIISRVTHASRLGRQRENEIYRLRKATSAPDLFAVFPRIFKSQHDLDDFHGEAFPSTVSKIFFQRPLGSPAGPLNEVIWAICRCIQFGTELGIFNALRKKFERAVITDERLIAIDTLDEIEQRFGMSMWLIQNRLSTAQSWAGVDEARLLSKKYSEAASGSPLAVILIEFIAKRVEAAGVGDYLKNDLIESLRRNVKEAVVETYLRTKLFHLWDMVTNDIPATLFLEAQSSVIDYYETLVMTLQAAASNNALPPALAQILEKPLLALARRTIDTRLAGAMRAFGIPDPAPIEISAERAAAIEAYSKGQYDECYATCTSLLAIFPDDMPIHVIRIKAAHHGGIALPKMDGVMHEVSQSLSEVIAAKENIHTGAFAVLTVAERHYGHEWASYLRAALLYELREESMQFPPPWMTDVYVRDPNLTPFSAICTRGRATEQMRLNPAIEAMFPVTFQIYRAVTTGQAESTQDARMRRYLGTYELTSGDAKKAYDYFLPLTSEGLVSDRARCAGGAALACLRLNNLEGAVRSLVAGYLSNPNAVPLLPITTIANELENPTKWPTIIDVPLALELYCAYIGREKLPTLRFAFERFQATHCIKHPADLLSRIDEHGKENVIQYLDKVWRPEVMSQTLIYSGTKEIDEARVEVCHALALLDPDDAQQYLAEVKARVKQQEIAKGTTLVEQSKVYVDIQAIKNALRRKLGDSYARYKSTLQGKSDHLIGKITEILTEDPNLKSISVSEILSALHLVGGQTTESDVQFSAIYSEITNEFLRGDHGLNAYLSTRVRHGTLTSTLRKSVADEHLVTSRRADGNGYLKNTFWKNPGKRELENTWTNIAAALDAFATSFDAIIEHVRDQLIQIRVAQDFAAPEENVNALFVYKTSNMERRFFQDFDQRVTNIDDLVSRCVDSLWEKTDRNLEVVQNELNQNVRAKLMAEFDKLTQFLDTASHTPGVGELMNAVARARTATNHRLAQVISWFKRSEVYDRPDYASEFPIQIAQNMVTRTMSESAGWQGVEILANTDKSHLPGRTLDGLVDVFYGLFENAIKHSGVAANDLQVKVELSYIGGELAANISSPIGKSIDLSVLERRIEEINSALRQASAKSLAQLDTRSGLYKVWTAINVPSFDAPFLNIELTADHSFSVRFGFKIAGVSYENTSN